jgi:hypothetical protein
MKIMIRAAYFVPLFAILFSLLLVNIQSSLSGSGKGKA